MRLVKVSVPEGLGAKIKETAFATGIRRLSITQVTAYFENGDSRPVENVDIETSTPKARQFVNRLLTEDYYDPSTISLNIRQPRSIISDEDVHDLTTPSG